VAYPALMDKSKIYLPPMHIKLGLIKISVKAVDKVGQGFGYLRQKFPNVCDAKLKKCIFIHPQMKQLFEDQDFSTKLNSTQRRAWKSSENACRNFLGKEKEENYSASVQEPISSHSSMGCNMSSKLHCLHSHSEFFFPKTWDPTLMNMMKGSIKIFP